ncbi:MAG: adenosine kinase [Rhodobacteraceae bacterium]|nr:adenosine kinase [Paracoccaceae bacterium]
MSAAEKSLDVVALGAAIVDILARVDDALLDRHGLPKGGMVLVDSEQATAIYDDMGQATEVSGGSAANTIAGLAALGASVGFVGKTKDDQLGKIFAHDIRAVGAKFDTPPFPADHNGATARSMILVSSDAQRTMCTDLGVSGLLDVSDVPTPLIEDAKVLYLEGYLWDNEATKASFRHAMTAAKAAGGQVALTLSDSFCVERHRDSFREIIQGPVDILFANEAEILSLYQTEDFEDAAVTAAQEVPLVALTRSENGCVVMRDGVRVAVEAEVIDELVDTTGAGDQYAAGFLFGLTQGADPGTCGRMGCVAAAEVIQHLGARPMADMKALFRERGLSS